MDSETQARALIEQSETFAAVGELPNGLSCDFHGEYSDQTRLIATYLLALQQAVDEPLGRIFSDVETAVQRLHHDADNVALIEEVEN